MGNGEYYHHCPMQVQKEKIMSDLFELRLQDKDLDIDPETIQAFFDMYLTPQIVRRLTDIHEDPEGVQNMLKAVKEMIAKNQGDLNPTRCYLCAKVLVDCSLSENFSRLTGKISLHLNS
jgi:hypothetical protein